MSVEHSIQLFHPLLHFFPILSFSFSFRIPHARGESASRSTRYKIDAIGHFFDVDHSHIWRRSACSTGNSMLQYICSQGPQAQQASKLFASVVKRSFTRKSEAEISPLIARHRFLVTCLFLYSATPPLYAHSSHNHSNNIARSVAFMQSTMTDSNSLFLLLSWK